MAGGADLVGRDDEVARLAAVVDACAAGRSALAVLEGEAGIGKSSLLRSVATGARLAGITVRQGRGDDLERDRPFRAAVEALGPIGDEEGAGDRGVEDLVARLEALSLDAGPVVLTLDDLQWADVGTLRFVRAAARRLSDLPIAIVVATRPTPRPPELAATLDELGRAGADTVLLDALAEPAVAELAAKVLDARCGSRLAGELVRTGGNPLYILELLAALRADGAVTVADGEADLGATTELPAGLRHTIVRRISVLPPATVDLLRTASVLGTAFDPAHLGVAVGRPMASLLADLRPALDAGFLVDGDGDGRLAFHHDLIRAAVYEDVPAAVRAVLHLDTAHALAAAGAVPADLLAHLDLGADRGDRATIDLWERVATAVRHTAPAPAIRLYERALARIPPADGRRRDQLLAGMAVPLASVGRNAEAERIAREVLGRPHDPALGPTLRDALHLALLRSGRTADDVAELEVVAARPDLDDDERLARRTDLAHALAVSGQMNRAAALVVENLPEARRRGDDRSIVRNLLVAMPVALCRGDVREAIVLGREALAVDRSLEHRVTADFMHGLALIEADRLDEARATLADGRRKELDEGEPSSATIYFWSLAGVDYLAGRWDDALAEIEAGQVFVADGIGAPIGLLVPRAVAARIHLHRGDLSRAEAELAAGQDRLFAHGPESGVDLLAWAQALVLAGAGGAEGGGGGAGGGAGGRGGAGADVHAAATVLTGIWRMLEEARYFMGWRLFGPDLVRFALAAGEPADAEAMAAGAALGAERSGGVPTAEAAALRCHALLHDDAPAAAKAAELLAESPRRVEAAWAAEDAGTLAVAVGERAAGVRHLQDALRRWEELGGDADAARVEATLKQLGARRSGRKPKRRPATGWASLTPTELAVVELAAEGRTNPQVAEVLFVSRRTVETHLAHVFAKLGLRSRVELAAAWARRGAR